MLLLASVALGGGLPPPSQLRVEHLLENSAANPIVVSTLRPRFGFVPLASEEGTALAAWRVTVSQAQLPVWDSGLVHSSNTVSIVCGELLESSAEYVWTAEWVAADGRRSPQTSARFDTGPASFGEGVWLGGGQRQFELSFELPPEARFESARLYVASPGGSTLTMNGRTVGDAVGVSAWTVFDKRVLYRSYGLGDFLGRNLSRHTAVLSVGGGFWSSLHVIGKGSWYQGPPVARVLLEVGSDGGRRRALKAPALRVRGRPGPVLADDPWTGSTIDWRLGAEDQWAELAPVPQADRPTGVLQAQQQPPLSVGPPVAATSVRRVKQEVWIYSFPQNMVGHAAVPAAAFQGPGNITLNHCEVLNGTECLPMKFLPAVLDTHVLPPGRLEHPLRPKFTWHGFQHVIVSATGGASFAGELDSLVAHATAAELEGTSEIHFAGEGSSILNGIYRIAGASQRDNLAAAWVPTDCPTREKHGWLGDAQVTAEEAMYNLFAPSVYELFLDTIQDQQISNASDPYWGFVPEVVPGAVNPPGDLSWTAAFPLIANWLHVYYGDLEPARKHWPALVAWTNGVLRAARQRNGTAALPDFFTCGDWCAVQARAQCTPGTGPEAAAANYLLAVKAMWDLARDLGDAVALAAFEKDLLDLRVSYDQRFWHEPAATYGIDPMELQTLSSISIAALGPAAHGSTRARRLEDAAAALVADVRQRGHHLTVGSAGQVTQPAPRRAAAGWHLTLPAEIPAGRALRDRTPRRCPARGDARIVPWLGVVAKPKRYHVLGKLERCRRPLPSPRPHPQPHLPVRWRGGMDAQGSRWHQALGSRLRARAHTAAHLQGRRTKRRQRHGRHGPRPHHVAMGQAHPRGRSGTASGRRPHHAPAFCARGRLGRPAAGAAAGPRRRAACHSAQRRAGPIRDANRAALWAPHHPCSGALIDFHCGPRRRALPTSWN